MTSPGPKAQTDPQANDSMTALAALLTEGIDPAPYFAMVAETLIARFGAGALALATRSIDEMRALGDDEGLELWQEVQAMLIRRLPDGRPGQHLH